MNRKFMAMFLSASLVLTAAPAIPGLEAGASAEELSLGSKTEGYLDLTGSNKSSDNLITYTLDKQYDCEGFLSSVTDGFEITTGAGIEISFKSRSNQTAKDNYETPIILVYTGDEPKFQGAGYKEYVAIRSDNWAWGPEGVGDKVAATWASSGYNMTDNFASDFANWETWLAANKSAEGADCKISAVKGDDKVTVTFVNHTVTSTTEFPYTGDGKIYLSISGQNCVFGNTLPSVDTPSDPTSPSDPTTPSDPTSPSDPTTPGDVDTSVNSFKGPYDCEGFLSVSTSGIEVTTDGIELEFKSRTKLAGTANWTTPCIIAYTGSEPKFNGKDYKEYAVIRSDAWAWSPSGDINTWASTDYKFESKFATDFANWETWLAANKSDEGVNCKISAIKKDGKITITFVNHTVTSVTEIPYTDDGKFYISVSGEQCVFGKTLPSAEKPKPLAPYPVVIPTPTPAPTLPPADANSEGIELVCDAFLSAQTSGQEVTESGTALTFRNTSDASAANNWETPVVIGYTGSEPIFNGAGYKEYVVVRSDNWAWGPAGVGDKAAATWASSGYNMTSNVGDPFDWAAWLASNKSGTDCKVQAVKADGKVYIEFTNGSITSVTSFPVADGEKIYISLSGEKCKLTNIKPAAYTGISGINAQPAASATPGTSAAPTQEPGASPAPGNTSTPSDPGTTGTPSDPVNTATPEDPSNTEKPSDPEPSEKPEKKTMKFSGVKAKTGTKKVTGTVSVKKATVQVKIGNKGYKKAKVNGKKFTFTASSKLKKGTKVTIKATKSGYKTVTKTVKVK